MRTVVVVGLGVALLLAGCGGGDDTPSAAGGTSSSSQPADAFGPDGSSTASPSAGSGGTTTESGETTPDSSPSSSPGSKGLTTSAWTTAANTACAQYARELPPEPSASDAAQTQSHIRDRAWAITGRLRGLPRGTSQTESFVQLLYGVGQQSDWLIQQYLDPKADKAAIATAVSKRDAQLDTWYGQARSLGTQECADVMKSV